jgi:hypothetical protein
VASDLDQAYLDRIDAAAERWKQNVIGAAPFTRARAEAQRAMMIHNRANPRSLCGIKGCDRHAYKGSLCRKHFALVPQSAKYEAWHDLYEAQQVAVAKVRRKQLALVRALLASASNA